MFPSTFLHEALPSRVLFGRGTLSRVSEEAQRLGMRRALVLDRDVLSAFSMIIRLAWDLLQWCGLLLRPRESL